MTGPRSGSLVWPRDSDTRAAKACAIAGVLAECGVVELTAFEARTGAMRTLRAREADLPREFAASTPGTTFSGRGVALLVAEGVLEWVADGQLAAGLERIGR